MSARQAFIPRPRSSAPSAELHPFDRPPSAQPDSITNNGKPRSIAGFLGRKKNTASPVVQEGTGPGTPGLGSSVRRSFDGLRRPEMTPISIIPYPNGGQPNTPGSGKVQGPGQTPRKTIGLEGFGFARPATPLGGACVPGLRGGVGKNGFGAFEGKVGDEEMGMDADGNGNGSGIVFMGPGGEMETKVGAGSGVAGYMRVLSASGSFGSGVGAGHGQEIVAPVPGYALNDLGKNPGPEDEDGMEGMYARSSRSLDTITEADVEMSMERGNEPQRTLRRARHVIGREDIEGNGRYADEDIQSQGSAKRMRRTQDDPDEYFRISSPHVPPTPALPVSHPTNASLTLDSMFEDIGEFISRQEFEEECKKWTNCTTEEWLKGADGLIKEYTEILDMVKDHLTEKVVSFANMMSSVEQKQIGLNSDTETLSDGMGIVTENITKLAKRK